MTALDALHRLGVNVVRTDAGGEGNSAECDCPVCGKRKFYVYLDSWPHHAICFGGGSHLRTNLPGLWARVKGMSYSHAHDELHRMLGIRGGGTPPPGMVRAGDARVLEREPDVAPIGRRDRIPHVTWLKSRGMKWSVVHEMGVSWDGDPASPWVYFPIFERGRMVSYERRCIVPEGEWRGGRRWIKSMGPGGGINNASFLYGFDITRRGSEVVLCEGIPDWFSLRQAGFEVLSTFGSSPSPRQINLLSELSPERIVMCFDSDPAGLSAFRKAAGMVRDTFVGPRPEVEAWFLPNGDANEIGSPDALRRSFDDRRMESIRALRRIGLGAARAARHKRSTGGTR